MKKRWASGLVILLLWLPGAGSAWGWSSETHRFIAQQAGLKYPESACFPDASREENKDLLGPFHWHNAAPGTVVTPEYIDAFPILKESHLTQNYFKPKKLNIMVPHQVGALYARIVDLYNRMQGKKGWAYDYYLGTVAHFVGDLSQPLHNYPHGKSLASDGQKYPEQGQWSAHRHQRFDNALNRHLPLDAAGEQQFRALLTPITITSEADLKKEIAQIANSAITLANKCYAEKRDHLTKDEAFRQAALSVSLLKGIIEGTGGGK